MEQISDYLNDWDNVSFDDKRLMLDGLITSIAATSERVKIQWKINSGWYRQNLMASLEWFCHVGEANKTIREVKVTQKPCT